MKRECPEYIQISEGRLTIRGTIFPLSDHTFVRWLGSGANGDTFLTRNDLLGRDEVVKIWHGKRGEQDPDADKVFGELKKNGEILGEKGVVAILTADELNGYIYATEEYVPGETLAEYLNTKPEFILRHSIIETILTNMSPIYEKGLFHGDLHTNNVIIDSSYTPHIIDFGTSVVTTKNRSHERDCRQLVALCYETLPELKKLSFITPDMILELESPTACDLLFWLTSVISKAEHLSSLETIDTYSKHEFALLLSVLIGEYPMLSADEVYSYYPSVIGEPYPECFKRTCTDD